MPECYYYCWPFHMFLIVLCQVIIVTAAQSADDGRIINAELMPLVPYQVSVRLKSIDELDFGAGHICGGSLISQRVVLSAAHCVVDTQASPMRFRRASEFRLVMGNIDLYLPTPYVYNVLYVFCEPTFNITTLVNDIAVFFMDGSVPNGLTAVHPIALNLLAIPSGTICLITGWGVTRIGSSQVSPLLMGAEVPIVSNAICAKAYANLKNLTIDQGMLCASNMQMDSADACQGDSGGPLVCSDGTLAGIVSWGNGCAQYGYPGIYTNISSYIKYIKYVNSTLDYGYYESASNPLLEPYFIILLLLLMTLRMM
ncbi:trypsin II-P29-like [Drosophila tropicalis]|uniref:trypsin II-P29-like n=1 Tax=Drosophila tropicalis TaxID=46794 RepID=UPI0035ABB30C